MQHLEEGTIHAWLDGELAPAERAQAEAHVAACAECAGAVAEARGFIAASSRILTALDSVPGGVLPASTASAPGPAVHRRFMASRAWMAVAAVLVLSTITVVATRPGGDTVQRQVAAVTRDQKSLPASAAPLEEKALELKPDVNQRAAKFDTIKTVTPAAPTASASTSAAAQAAGGAVARNTPAMMQSRAAAPDDEAKSVDQNERLKSRLEAERKSTLVRPQSGEPGARAAIAPPASNAGEPGAANRMAVRSAAPLADSVDEKDMADKREAAFSVNDSANELRAGTSARGVTITGRVTNQAGAPLASASVVLEGTHIATSTHADGSYALDVPAARANGQTTSLAVRLIGYKTVADSIALADAPMTHDFVLASNPVTLSEVVVTGAGATAPSRKLGAVTGTNASPVVVSRSTSTESGDSVLTTVYAVTNGTVTLIERSSARDALRRQKPDAGFSDQLMAKAREDDARINSITWSDSSGRTRTLRGAIPREDLERIRTALFGATP
ncbi:MAG TPA: carboxypeptidase-like regulatory domain-containing protein [Gemmatimonadaceae bacterium]|jgi:hypothetical protein